MRGPEIHAPNMTVTSVPFRLNEKRVAEKRSGESHHFLLRLEMYNILFCFDFLNFIRRIFFPCIYSNRSTRFQKHHLLYIYTSLENGIKFDWLRQILWFQRKNVRKRIRGDQPPRDTLIFRAPVKNPLCRHRYRCRVGEWCERVAGGKRSGWRMCRAEVPVEPFAIGQWADRKPENALRTLFSPFSLSAHPCVSSPLSDAFSLVRTNTNTHTSTLTPAQTRALAHICMYTRRTYPRRGRKYLISAKSRKSQHRAFCVIKPRPQKLYGFTKRLFPPRASFVPRNGSFGECQSKCHTYKAKKRIYNFFFHFILFYFIPEVWYIIYRRIRDLRTHLYTYTT